MGSLRSGLSGQRGGVSYLWCGAWSTAEGAVEVAAVVGVAAEAVEAGVGAVGEVGAW